MASPKRKEIREFRCASSLAVQAMELYGEPMDRLIRASVGAEWVQAKFEINGVERVIRASYRRGVVTLSAPTEA